MDEQIPVPRDNVKINISIGKHEGGINVIEQLGFNISRVYQTIPVHAAPSSVAHGEYSEKSQTIGLQELERASHRPKRPLLLLLVHHFLMHLSFLP